MVLHYEHSHAHDTAEGIASTADSGTAVQAGVLGGGTYRGHKNNGTAKLSILLSGEKIKSTKHG